MKRFFAVVVLLLAAVASGSALAHGGRARVHLGFHFGFPLAWHYPYYYPPPVYYYPTPAVVAAPPPPVYVERSDVVPEGPGTWHFCPESKGYYPYVKQCPGGWQRVPAQPPQ
jgi:hypothetical protein